MSKKPSNAEVLSVFVGSRLMPGRDGKPQKPLSIGEAEKEAERKHRKREGA